jgi:Sigma-70, region 4
MNSAGNRQQETVNRGRSVRLHLVARIPQASVAEDVDVLREGSTGRVVVMLPRVWAVEETGNFVETHVRESGHGAPRSVAEGQPGSRPKVEVAFYRKYSEAMLRRYLRMSMEAGRVPSLLGREMFRGNVTSYRVHSFEDVVVFCLDVERCLAKLNPEEKDLIRRVALQQYTQAETAAVLGVGVRYVSKRYAAALDRLTWMFLEAQMLEPLKSCQ